MSYLVLSNAEVLDGLNVPARDMHQGILSYDIETTGLDPRESDITEISFSDQEKTYIFTTDGDEHAVIQSAFDWFDHYIRQNPLSCLVSWNGWGFDVPFIQVRSDALAGEGNEVSIWKKRAQLVERADVKSKYPVAGGFKHPQTLLWDGRWQDTDIEKSFMDIAHSNGISHGLKPVSKFYGYTPIEVDRTRMDLLTDEERILYVCSDTIMTAALAGKVLQDR